MGSDSARVNRLGDNGGAGQTVGKFIGKKQVGQLRLGVGLFPVVLHRAQIPFPVRPRGPVAAGGHGYDPALGCRQDSFQQQAGEQEMPEVIRRKGHLVPVGTLVEMVKTGAGIVDQDVDGPVALRDGSGRLAYVPLHGKIRAKEFNLSGVG